MDRDTVSRVFEEMEHPPTTDVEFEIVDVSETYSSTDESPIHVLEDYKDPESVWSEISRFIIALENKKKDIEETEVQCIGITIQQAKEKLSLFIDHLLYYIAFEPKSEFLIGDTKNIIISFEGSILSVAGQALAQALVSGCAVVLMVYEKFSSTAKILSKIWIEAGLPGGRFQVRTDFPESLCSVQPSLKIFVGGQLIDGSEYHNLKPYFLNGYSTPMLVLDGADIESVVSVLLEKNNVLRHVEPWALTVIVIQESQLPKFKELILERRNVSDINRPSPLVQKEHIEQIRRYHLQNQDSAEVHNLCQYRYLVFDAQPTRASRPWYHDLNGQPLYVLPVRSAAEAVTKANHFGSGYAAAVFTEDGSLSQYVSEKLRASTVWINTIGQLHPAAPLPFQIVNTNFLGHCQLNTDQSSGNISNLLRFGTIMSLTEYEGTGASEVADIPFSQEVQDKVKAAVTAQPAWEALGGIGRNRIFFKLYNETLSKIPEEARIRPTPRQNPVEMEVGDDEGPSLLCTVSLVNCVQEVGSPLSENLRRSSSFLKRTTMTAETTYANQESGHTVTTHLLPCGVIGIYVDNSVCSKRRERKILSVSGRHKVFVKGSDAEDVVEIIQGAIAFGNTCVVILADDADYQLIDLIYGATSCLPKGVVNIIKSKEPTHWVSLVKHQEVKCLWHSDVLMQPEHKLLKYIEAKYSKRVWIGIINYLAKIKNHVAASLGPFEPHATIKKHVWRKSQAN